MRQIKVLAVLFALLPGIAAAQQTLPSNTVWGRLGISAGPAQAIPFAALFAGAGVVAGPQSCSSHNWFNSLSSGGGLGCAQPSFADLSGTIAAAQLIPPTGSTLGGVQSKDCTSGSQFVQKINTDGTITCATPSGAGTMTGLTAGQGCTSGTGGQTQITVSGTINCPTGSSNKLRNSSISSWLHGNGTLTVTTSGGWCAEGIYLVPTGASATCAQHANALTNPLTLWSQLITGAASVTDVTVRFVIESIDAAPLAGQQVTCQFPVLNNTGGSITPTLTVKRANAPDSTYTNTDVSAASLQTIANGATGTLAYSWAANASSFNGLSIDVDFGNNFSTTGKSIQIGGGFDCHVTPSVSTGTVSAPPAPEIRSVAEDLSWNQRFYVTNLPSGTAPCSATHNGMAYAGFTISGLASVGVVQFPVQMRATPSISYCDGAGNTSKISWAATATTSIAFTDAVAASVPPTDISATGFLISGAGALTNVTSFVNYAADATLSGG